MKTKTSKRNKPKVQVFSDEQNQCIWMKAGVVNFKLCDNAYDCLSCPFDKAMSRSLAHKPEQIISWRQAMKEMSYNQKECRHMLTGRVQYRLCANSYRCNVCEFDQALEESDLKVAPGAVHSKKVSGFEVAENYYYHRGHSWARIEHGGLIRIGIDDFALKLLGTPTEIDLPKLGSHLEQTEVGWSVKRDRNSARVLAPVDGVVVATNHKALGHPDLTKKRPYGEGWLMVVEPRNLKANLKNLLFEEEVKVWVDAEYNKLETMVMDTYGMSMAATGGEIVDDIYGNLPNMKWDKLVHEFLLT